MTRLRAALTALVLAVSVLLTGCSQGAPTTAAVVNGVVIQEQAVVAVAAGLSAVSGKAQQAHSDAFTTLVEGELARQIAQQKGITLVAPDMDSLIQKYPTLAAFLSSNEGRQFATDSVSWSQLSNTLSTEELTAAVNEQEVLLNPRYGIWGQRLGSGSLSEVAPSK